MTGARAAAPLPLPESAASHPPWRSLTAIIDSLFRLREHPGMTVIKPPDKLPPEEDTALLIAAMNQAWAMYDAEINRGLQIVNYFLVATAVLATAYVSAINGKHSAIAAVIALAGMATTIAAFIQGLRQRETAYPASLVTRELYGRVAGKLKIESIPVARASLATG